jgi:SAM-dependent methyltransferase
MQEHVKEFVQLCIDNFSTPEPIYEFGSLQVEGQEVWADLRPYFKDKKYVGCDMREGLGVDVILNLHDIELPSESVGTVLLLETLEHVEYPYKALDEIYRILKPGGVIIMSSLLNFPIHEHPFDYWRFTPEAFNSLLKKFKTKFVGYIGEDDFPNSILGIGIKDETISTEQFSQQFKKWKNEKEIEFGSHIIPTEQYISRLKYWKSLGYRSTKAFTIWLTPPFLLPAIQFLFNRKKYNKI